MDGFFEVLCAEASYQFAIQSCSRSRDTRCRRKRFWAGYSRDMALYRQALQNIINGRAAAGRTPVE